MAFIGDGLLQYIHDEASNAAWIDGVAHCHRRIQGRDRAHRIHRKDPAIENRE